MDTKIFITYAKRGYIGNELYVFGVIHGLQMTICDKTITGIYDCELYKRKCIFFTNTTEEQYNTFRKTVETIYPGLCEFDVKDQA